MSNQARSPQADHSAETTSDRTRTVLVVSRPRRLSRPSASNPTARAMLGGEETNSMWRPLQRPSPIHGGNGFARRRVTLYIAGRLRWRQAPPPAPSENRPRPALLPPRARSRHAGPPTQRLVLSFS